MSSLLFSSLQLAIEQTIPAGFWAAGTEHMHHSIRRWAAVFCALPFLARRAFQGNNRAQQENGMYQRAAQLKGASGCAAAQQCAVQSTQRLQRPVCGPGVLQGCSTAARPFPHLRSAELPPQPENANESFKVLKVTAEASLLPWRAARMHLAADSFPMS